MTINEFILKYRDIKVLQDYRGTEMEKEFEDGIMRRVMNPYVICNDDFEFSCQASSTHYSEPKGLADEYTQVEIGYPKFCMKKAKKAVRIFLLLWFQKKRQCQVFFMCLRVDKQMSLSQALKAKKFLFLNGTCINTQI